MTNQKPTGEAPDNQIRRALVAHAQGATIVHRKVVELDARKAMADGLVQRHHLDAFTANALAGTAMRALEENHYIVKEKEP